MYRIFLPFFLALFFTGIPLSAQVPEEEIEIEVEEEGENTTPIIRTPQIIPITYVYYPDSNIAILTFTSDLGSVTITVSNAITGDDIYYHNGTGSELISIPETGFTIICINSGNEHYYYAYINTPQN